jgi:hypothetical protein
VRVRIGLWLGASVSVALALAGLARVAARLEFSGAPWASKRVLAADGGQVLHVPRGGGNVVIDGDTDDAAWTATPGPARTGPFVAPSGQRATPASEARLLWGDGHLYVLLYAADEDVRSRGDFFRLTFTRELDPPRTFVFDVSPSGAPPEGVHLAREIDGTLDDARDRDEEWVVEMAVALAPMGIESARGETFGLGVRRGDAAWSGRVVLD